MTNSTQLVRAAQSGDTNAVAQLYMTTFNSAYLTAKSIVQKQSDAQQLVKDSYLEAFYNINMIPDVSRFDKWFNTIADKKAKEYLLQINPNIFPKTISAAATLWNDDTMLASAPVAPNLAGGAMNTIYALPENQKLILIMFYNQRLSIAEIADTLSLSQDEVKGTLFNARQAVERGVAPINPMGTATAAIITASFNQAAQTCTAPQGQIDEIINTLTGGAAAPTPSQNIPSAQPTAQNFNTAQPSAPVENFQPNRTEPVINGVPQSGTAIQSGMSKGTKLALIIGGAALLVIIAAVVIFFVFFSKPKSGSVDATLPATVIETEPTEPEPETQNNRIEPETTGNASSDKIHDDKYNLPENYKYAGAKYDSKKGFDSGFGIDEKETITAFEKLPEIKSIVDDKNSYIRYKVTQRGSSREIFNYYSGDDVSYSVFIDTSDRACEAPTRLNLIFSSSGDKKLSDLRATAQKLLELTTLDPQLINAMLYSNLEELDAIKVKDDLGNIYVSNSLTEDSLNASITYYPSYVQDAPKDIKPKYFEDDLSKYFDINKVFNNSDVDFNKDLTAQGISKLKSVDYAKNVSNEYYSPSISYTTDQNGKITEVSYDISDSITFDSKDGKISTAAINVSYSENQWGDTDGEISLEYTDGAGCPEDCARLAAEQFKFFDKDFNLSEKELTLKDEDNKELSVKTKLSPNGNAVLEIENDGTDITYTLNFEVD
ncbi:MAG: RNA polymerase sigma factor, partial [Acutalibacteraceae bacterium]